jgi:hypothetical protein
MNGKMARGLLLPFVYLKGMTRQNKHTNEFICRQTIDICVIIAPAYFFLLSFVISMSEAATLIYSIHI